MGVNLKIYKEKYERTVWSSKNFGDFIIVDYLKNTCVLIRFLDTGYETYVHMCSIKNGCVKDKLKPSVFGVGFIGEGPYKPSHEGRDTKIYKTWHGMLRRCYSENSLAYKQTYKDCTVVDEWHSFQNFSLWCEENYIEGYELDKDIKVDGNKVYGPDTCVFVSQKHNIEKAFAKNYKVVNPKGSIIDIYNMAKFCRENNLEQSSMYSVANGSRKQHKGWTKYTPDEEKELQDCTRTYRRGINHEI